MNNDFFKDRFESYDVAEFSFYGSVRRDLEMFIKEHATFFDTPDLKLTPKRLSYLTKLLVEFAEDLHYDVGLWRSVEEYNQKLFYTPLPLIVRYKHEIKEKFDKNRFKFFIFNMMLEFKPYLIISPTHPGLELFSKQLSTFFKAHFKNAPAKSTLKLFLNEPDDYMWDFKQKVVFVGTKSYLFRLCFRNFYKESQNSPGDIETIDKFVNEHPTKWSGALVTEITAMAVNLPKNLRKDVETWYERHTSIYKFISWNNNNLIMENIVNNQIYEIYFDFKSNPFIENKYMMGGLVKFDNKWHWSGSQHIFGKLEEDEEKINELKNKLISDLPQIVYRYDIKRLEMARESLLKDYNDFVEFFGSDLVIFENGKTLESEFKKKILFAYNKISDEQKKQYFEEYGKQIEIPTFDFTGNLHESENQIAAHFNPDIGFEFVLQYDLFISGLQKQGVGLEEEEKEVIYVLITDKRVSPQFIKRITDEYGTQSIQKVFYLDIDDNNLEYLLRVYKGKSFRKQYPHVSMI